MDMTAAVVCRAFLDKCPFHRREALWSYLSPTEQAKLEVVLPPYQDPAQGIAGVSEQLEKIHFSWFSPFLRTLSEQEIKLFVACLSPPQADGLKKLLLFTNQLPSPSSQVKQFLQEVLLEKVSEPEILPREFVPASSLNSLLSLSDKELRLLVEMLGMHDLSADIRLIIETAKLKKIQSLLSKDQLLYLKMISQQKEPLTFGKMALEKWDGKAESLQFLIRYRGLNRLAKALNAEDPSLFWHVSHQLDMENAATLKKLSTPVEHRRALIFLAEQILNVASYIQKQTAP